MNRKEIQEFDFHALLKAGHEHPVINAALTSELNSKIDYDLTLLYPNELISGRFKKSLLKAYREKIEPFSELKRIYEKHVGTFEHKLFHYKEGLVGKFVSKEEAEKIMKKMGGVFQWDDGDFNHLIIR